ncbi:MAG TPA: Nudix family hydrolase [Burkholderiaceae bacterium]|nr:Nudix family hydrolase [Burkholderiaceae bacterium]
MTKPFIDVAAGMILRADGALLLAERPADKPWAGWWELPGGKIETGETTLQALARELKEELGIDVTEATPWVTYVHEYPKTIVRLAFCRVTGWTGEPTGIEGQRLAWVNPGAPLAVGPLLPATEPPLRWHQLPSRYLITSIGSDENVRPFTDKLASALERGIRLVQFREQAYGAASEEGAYRAFQRVLKLCRNAGARCLVNSCHPESWWKEADGVHFRAADARLRVAQTDASQEERALPARPAFDNGDEIPGLIGVSAHDEADIQAARALKADFAVLGHVLDTPSHPEQPGMGWARFAELAAPAGLPVFAIGGQSEETVPEARQHGAHGIAGIRHL